MLDPLNADVKEKHQGGRSSSPAFLRSTVPQVSRPAARGLSSFNGAWQYHAVLTFFTLLWGSNFVLAEVALFEMTPISFSVARFFMGGVGMLLLFYGHGYSKRDTDIPLAFPRIRRAEWPRLILVSLIGATLAPWLGIEGLAHTHAGRAAVWLALAPIVSAVLGVWLGTERIHRTGRAGVLLAGLGTLGLAVDGVWLDQGHRVGDLLLVAALILAVTELHLIKPLANRYGAIPIVTARTLIGWVFYMIIATPSMLQQNWLELSYWTWAAIVIGGTVGLGMGQWAKVRALRAIGPTQVVVYGNLVPLVTIAIGWATIGTAAAPVELAAAALIVAGAFCLQKGGSSATEHGPPVA